jgi:lipopolysaccharide export system protein LptA
MLDKTASCAALLLVLTLTGGSALGAGEKKNPEPKPADNAADKPADNKGGTDASSMFGGFSFTSKKEPIEINSQKLDFDYKKRRTVFRGDVEVVQGDVHLRTDTMTVDYDQVGDKQQLKEVTADGNVSIVQGAKKATGSHAVFDQAKRTVILTGNAVLEEGTNQVNGDKIVVYPDDSRMEVIGQNRRVKVILFPGKEPQQQGTPGAEATPPPAGAAAGPTASSGTEANGAGQGS